MGNADIRSLAAISEVEFDDLAGSVVAVDAHNWLYRYLTTTVKFTRDGAYTTADGEEVANLIGVVQGLPKFFEHDITPVFVFDGGVTDLKSDEVDERREQREQYEAELETAKAEGEDSARIATLQSRTQRLTNTIHETTRGLLARLDVPIVEAPAEGRHRPPTWPEPAWRITSAARITTRSCSVLPTRSGNSPRRGVRS